MKEMKFRPQLILHNLQKLTYLYHLSLPPTALHKL